MELNVYNHAGSVARQVTVQDAVFGVRFAQAAVHQSFLRYLANQRQGTHSTKTRGEVAGSTRKLFRQKGTGRARQGSARAPHRKGGGTAHGPKPRDYRQEMPKKMRRLALKSVLSAKARDGELFIVEALDFAAPKTKEMVRVLTALGLNGSTLLVTSGAPRNVLLSARNIPWLHTTAANLLNIGDLIRHRNIVLTAEAIAEIERVWGDGSTAAPEAATEAPAATAATTPRRRTTRAATAAPAGIAEAEAVGDVGTGAGEDAAPATRRRRTTRAAAEPEATAEGQAEAETTPAAEAEEKAE